MVTYEHVASFAGRGPGAGLFTESLRGVALDARDQIYALGDDKLEIFSLDGASIGQWSTRREGHSIAVADDDRVFVGYSGGLSIFDARGNLLETWTDNGQLGLITAIGFGTDDVFLGDAHARCIHRFGLDGKLRNRIGDQHRKGGFHIPNGVVDFAVDAQDIVHVANPGMHRVESYTASGEQLGYFGRFDGQDPAGFPGCCNPTNVALSRTGDVVVTEKAAPRTKMYSSDGELLAVIASDIFDPASKNMDVAVDSRDRILVADPIRLAILAFARVGLEVPP